MAEIDELHQRITAALDRIGRGVSGLEPPAPEGSGDTAALTAELEAARAALEDERTANAQLEERVRAIRARHEQGMQEMQGQADKASAAVAALDAELQQLRQVNAELRKNNAALREANAAGVGDAHLINKSLQSELDALHAERCAEAAEARAVLGALEPLLAAAESGSDDEKEETA